MSPRREERISERVRYGRDVGRLEERAAVVRGERRTRRGNNAGRGKGLGDARRGVRRVTRGRIFQSNARASNGVVQRRLRSPYELTCVRTTVDGLI